MLDISWVTERIAVGGAIWSEARMIEVVRAGITHILDMQIEFDDTPLASPYGVQVLWNPVDDVLTRVDLATGDMSTGTGNETADTSGPLAAIGRWLAPTAAAKVLLSAGIAISPDGSRVYALGIRNGRTGTEVASSAGVFVFDATSLAQVSHWTATADFVSLALSSDGRYLYAAGSPEANATGTVTTRAASITVFNTGDGSVRLIAGQLGPGFLLFPSTIVR